MDISATIQLVITQGENQNAEFKTSFGDEVIISLVAFANAKGGKVYVGVNDKGKVTGVTHGKETVQQWINEIKTKTEPSLIPDSETVEIEDKIVVVLSVAEYPVKPVSVKGRYYKRTGNSNHLMSVAEVANMHLQTVNSSWDYYPRPEKTTADLSFEKVQRAIDIITRRNPNNRIASAEEFLQKHELVKGVAITNACYLMFCKDENLYTTIQMGHFASETVIKDDVTTSNDILSQVDEVMSFVIKHINKEIIISGQPENTEHWQYPLEGIREIVLNMIIHRDYTSPADSIVKVFSDHILFYNPGNLPNNITIGQLLSNTYVSTPRNRQIAKITKEMGWIEKYGTGIKRVLDIFRDYGLPQPRFELIPGGFAVTVFSEIGQNGKQKTDLKADLKTNLKTNLKTDNIDGKIISLIADNKHITIPEIANNINLSVSGTKLRINRLRNNGSIARVGPAKGGHWEITKP